jgi:hypothetical protein
MGEDHNALKSSLPSWFFDINEDDESIINSSQSVLDELEINPSHIIEVVKWNLFCPFFGIIKRFSCNSAILNRIMLEDYSSHPIKLVSSYKRTALFEYDDNDDVNEKVDENDTETSSNTDFWGPLFITTIFSSLLWLGNQRNVPYVYVIWCLSAILCHVTCRSFLDGSTIGFHLSILGYSLVPQIPLCFIILALRPSLTASTIIQFFCVVYSMCAALMSYNMIIRPLIEPRSRNKLLLLLPVVFLFELYIITLVPMRRWQINHGNPITIM